MMEVINAIVGAIVIALCALPFILMGRARNKSKIRLIDKIKSMASEYNGDISVFEVGSIFAIGLDESDKRLYFVKTVDGETEYDTIHLKPYKSCEIVQDTHVHESNGESTVVIDKISILFKGSKKSGETAVLNIFDADRTIELQGELMFAKSWMNRINSLLIA